MQHTCTLPEQQSASRQLSHVLSRFSEVRKGKKHCEHIFSKYLGQPLRRRLGLFYVVNRHFMCIQCEKMEMERPAVWH